MSRREPWDAIVVGAGMVGAAAALAMVRGGWRIALVESRAAPIWSAADPVDPRVSALASAARRLLDDLGVWPSIAAARCGVVRRMAIWDAGGSGRLRFDAADGTDPTLAHIVENCLTQHALWRALVASSGLTMHCPARLVAVRHEAQGVSVELDDASVLRARLLIGADGAESRVRELAGIATRGHAYGQRGVVCHVQTERPHQDCAWQRFLPGGPLALLPLGDGRCSIVWTLPDAEAARVLALDDSAFCAELSVASERCLGTVVAASARAAFPLRLQLAERYAGERIALIGDAAHVVHPLAGQGVNLGFLDVVTLVKVLSEARAAGRDLGAPATLRRYERQRRSEDGIAAYAFDGIGKLFGSKAAGVVRARNFGLGVVDGLPLLKQFFMGHAAGSGQRLGSTS